MRLFLLQVVKVLKQSSVPLLLHLAAKRLTGLSALLP